MAVVASLCYWIPISALLQLSWQTAGQCLPARGRIARTTKFLLSRRLATPCTAGAFVSATKRYSQNFQLGASYTLDWSFNQNDSVGDNGSNVIKSTNYRGDWAFSSSDQPHRFVLQGVWQPVLKQSGIVGEILNGWMLAPNITITSGFPFTPVAGSDLNKDGVNNDYPLFAHRNDFRGPGFTEVNVRLSRKFPLYKERVGLELIGEAETY